MQPYKIIEPSEEIEKEGKNNLINTARDNEVSKHEYVKVLTLNQLDIKGNSAINQANVLIAEEKIKNLPNENNLNDTPYIHNSTEGFGASPGQGGYSLLRLFPNNKSQRILTVALIILMILGLIVKYGSKL